MTQDLSAGAFASIHRDDKLVMRACGWAAAALVVMAVAGLLP